MWSVSFPLIWWFEKGCRISLGILQAAFASSGLCCSVSEEYHYVVELILIGLICEVQLQCLVVAVTWITVPGLADPQVLMYFKKNKFENWNQTNSLEQSFCRKERKVICYPTYADLAQLSAHKFNDNSFYLAAISNTLG